jgi:hypothetical protein
MAAPNLLALTLATALLLTACDDDDVPTCTGADCGSGGGTAGGAQGGDGGGLACPDSGVLYGPWSLNVGGTSATVRWDGCKPAPVELEVEPETGGTPVLASGEQTAAELTTEHTLSDVPDLPGTHYLSQVAVQGLSPATCYRYRIAHEPERQGRFCTARESGDELTFLAIGDTNPTLGDNTTRLLSHALPAQPDFTVHLGDLQYYSSVFESWGTWFPLMQPLLSAGAFQPSIGNHESEKPSEFEDYYTRYFSGAGDGDLHRYKFQSGGVWFFSLDTELGLGEGSEQAEWLLAELAAAAAQPGYRFSVLYFHKPLITCGDTGQDKDARLYLEPFFLQHGVRLVLQGHMHGYERFEVGAVTYVTSAGGGGLLGNVDENTDTRPEEALLRQAAFNAFNVTLIEIETGEIAGTVLNEEGEVIDAFAHTVP